MTCRLFFQNLISLYTRREYHCIFSFSDKTIALSDSRTICHLYFQIFSIYMFIPSHISFLWQCSSTSILKQYPRIFFGNWICILVSLFSDKNIEYISDKILGYLSLNILYYKQYNCKPFVPVFFWNNVLENIMLKPNHQYIFHRLTFSLHIIYFLTTSLQA